MVDSGAAVSYENDYIRFNQGGMAMPTIGKVPSITCGITAAIIPFHHYS